MGPATKYSRKANIVEAAERLTASWTSSIPCDPVRDLLNDVEEAYEVQRMFRASIAIGGPSGWKIGLTSKEVQRQLNVEQPDYGALYTGMEIVPGGVIEGGVLIQPKVEAEVAFVLNADVQDANRIRDSIGFVAPALEVVDSRIIGWDISILDTIADNASCGRYALGGPRRPLKDIETSAVQMTLSRNGTAVSTGTGRECLGDPLIAVSWLAAKILSYGEQLRSGDIILSGALGPMVEALPGDEFVAELSTLGKVAVRFGGGPGTEDTDGGAVAPPH